MHHCKYRKSLNPCEKHIMRMESFKSVADRHNLFLRHQLLCNPSWVPIKFIFPTSWKTKHAYCVCQLNTSFKFEISHMIANGESLNPCKNLIMRMITFKSRAETFCFNTLHQLRYNVSRPYWIKQFCDSSKTTTCIVMEHHLNHRQNPICIIANIGSLWILAKNT